MDDIWAYPYRLGIGLFFLASTVAFMVVFIGLAIWLEKALKDDPNK